MRVKMVKEEHWLLTEKYHGVETAEFFADRDKLAAGEPLAYILGHVPFLNTTIHLDSRPLIPRPETEFWTERAIAAIKDSDIPQPRALDLCAGSGAVGIAVAHALPNVHVTFAEIDRAHLPTIAKNLEANSIPCTRYRVFQSDLFNNLPDSRYDFILSNPPYIDPALDRVAESVAAFEPEQALYGGEGGLTIISRIITEAPQHLTNQGQLWIEHEPEQSQAIQAQAREHGFTVVTYKDQYETERFSVLTF